MSGQHASHVPGGYAYTSSTQPSTSHALPDPIVYDAASLSQIPQMTAVDTARSSPAGYPLRFHSETMGDTRARALAAQSHPSFARHFQHYDQLSLTDNYAPSTFDGNAVQHTPIGQPVLTFPQSAATTHHVSHGLQNTYLNDSLAPSGTMVMPSSSENVDPMTMRTFMHTSPP